MVGAFQKVKDKSQYEKIFAVRYNDKFLNTKKVFVQNFDRQTCFKMSAGLYRTIVSQKKPLQGFF